MGTYLLTVALLFGLMAAGIGCERLYRRFQRRHPEWGPYRRSDGGCNCHQPVGEGSGGPPAAQVIVIFRR